MNAHAQSTPSATAPREARRRGDTALAAGASGGLRSERPIFRCGKGRQQVYG
jgi:hypothetical protein